MTETPFYGWKHKTTGQIAIPSLMVLTLDELFAGSSFGLPVRDVETHVPIRLKFINGNFVEDVEPEVDRLWRLVCEASST
jgi:hypothetical protein